MSTSIDAVLSTAVSSGSVPNIVALAADDEGVIYEGSAGPVTAGTVFRIASMTKVVCTVAALQQRERGALDFGAPVEDYCPEFAAVRVLDGFENGKPVLRAPATRATVKQLVTHTAGLTYGFWNATIDRWQRETGIGDVFATPLVADPGTRFEYGISTDWLGKVVEAAAGRPLDGYLTDNVFAPLDMKDTTFLRTDDQRRRSVPVHDRTPDGGWVATDIDWDQHPSYFSGGHGLYCTPRDFLRIQRMLLGEGSLGGASILSPASVREAFTNQIGELDFPALIRTADPVASCDYAAGPGLKWGWGLQLTTHDQPGRRSAGSGGWAGIFNTFFWVDPAARITAAVYTQSRPFLDPDVLRTYAAFEDALYASRR
ncbi:serine hydrolase domain-containing protein [Actinoplanes sp. CA-142083]|uniref:serine hydrolase domain-containing protein n=1 Tax=Actinoplanes sp. CA-142083 TaxID=3239903 RepID=UPI003D8DA91D